MKLPMALVASLFLIACSGVEVTKDNNQPDGDVGGIPFFAKTPVRIHETKASRTAVLVDVEVAKVDKKGKPIGTSQHIPTGGPKLVADNNETARRLDELAAQLSNDQITEPLKTFVARITMLVEGLEPANEATLPAKLVSNTWHVENVVGPQRYFIKNKIPAMGSSQAEFDLASDGTLTKVTTQAEDKTASTLLSLVPIAGYFTHQWGLDNKTSGDTTGTEAFDGGTHKKITAIPIKATLTVTKQVKVYSLRKVSPICKATDRMLTNVLGQHDADGMDCLTSQPPSASAPLECPAYDDPNKQSDGCGSATCPLTIACGEKGKGGVEIVSVDLADAAAKDDAPSYGVSGKITLPKTTDDK